MSLVDVLAEKVSREIGAEIRVLRLINPNLDRIGRPRVGCYRLVVSRNGFEFSSGDMRVDEAKKFLALVADWIAMGFVRLEAE